MATITELQKNLVKALETRQDPAPILKELAEFRAKAEAAKDLAEGQKIADERQALRAKAETVKGKVQKQEEAISRFLGLRDSLVSQLQPLIEPMKELAKMQTMQRDGPGDCYAGYFDLSQFAGDVRGIPIDYLDKDFGCPFLTMKGGKVDARDKAGEAYNYLIWTVGILSSFEKSLSQVNLKDAEGLMAIEPESGNGRCVVCSHPEVETINNLLRQGKPLRDIESEFDNISRSSLSRHKNKCLKLGIIKIERESPAASANSTFFHG
jgi:hypothetical protein